LVKDVVKAHWFRAVPKNLAMVYEGELLGESGDTFISGLTPQNFRQTNLYRAIG
jgi:hypothetical protein